MIDQDKEQVEMEHGSKIGEEMFKSLSSHSDTTQLFAAMECLALVCRKRSKGRDDLDFENQFDSVLSLVIAKVYDLPEAQ